MRKAGRKTSFFQKPLGIFVLSTLLVGSASYWFTRYETQQKEAEVKRAATEREHDIKTEAQPKLDIEFVHRFNKVDEYLAKTEAEITNKKDTYNSQFLLTHVMYILDGQKYESETDIKPLKSAFPEHREREFQPMVYDLQTMVWDADERGKLSGMITNYKKLYDRTRKTLDLKNRDKDTIAAIGWCGQMLDELRKSRANWTANK